MTVRSFNGIAHAPLRGKVWLQLPDGGNGHEMAPEEAREIGQRLIADADEAQGQAR